jgi:hypothetical protein
VTARVRAATLLIVLAVAALLGGCGSDHHDRVYVFGDSLVAQGTKYLGQQLRADDFDPHIVSLSGSATCDWFENARRDQKKVDPDVVVISFSGNALSPCMKHPDGTALSNREYVDKYRADTERVLRTFGDDVPVYLVGAPISGVGDDRVYRLYERLARDHPNWHFVDGGKYVTPHHEYAQTLPCLRGEPCTGPVVDGVRHNIVRAPDHAHFCPVATPLGNPCPVYASGAYRFARAIAEAVKQGES